MFALLIASVLASLPVASAAEPTLRNLDSIQQPFTEIELTIPVNGCSYRNRCTRVDNTTGSWLSVEVPGKNHSDIWTNRVLDGDDIVVGVYTDTLPEFRGETIQMVVDNQLVPVPVVYGVFIAAIPPCIHNNKESGYIKLDSDPVLSIKGTTWDFDGNDRETAVVFDAGTNSLVRAPLGGYAIRGATQKRLLTMFESDGQPASLWTEGWGYIQFGNYNCR